MKQLFALMLVSVVPIATLRAQDTAAVAISPVVTVGTRAGDRTSTTSPVPVDALTSDAIEASGLTETWQILQRLIPTANSAHLPRGDDGIRPVMLRGLSPVQTLILVNGKRLHNPAVILGGAVLSGNPANDIGSIPAMAIERIEILRDGAAAQYGSDAIAGVINLVLKAETGFHARSSLGGVSSSEGGRTFHDGTAAAASASYGSRFNNSGYAVLTAQLDRRGTTNRAYPDQRPQYFSGDPRNSLPPIVRNQEGDGELHNASLLLNAAIPLWNRRELYLTASMAHRNAQSSSLFRRASESANVIRALHPDGLLPKFDRDLDDFFVTAGLRTNMSGWNVDASSTIGGNRFSTRLHDSNNASMGVKSPTDFYIGEQRASQWTSNLDVTRSLPVFRELSIKLASGVELRVDAYGIKAGDSASYVNGGQPILDGPSQGQAAAIGAQGVAGFQPADEVSARRSNIAAYLDVESRPVNRLIIDAAGRAERYSDFGGTLDGKIAARIELARGVSLRGSQGTGFRAPSLNQSNLSATRSAFIITNGLAGVFQIRTLPVRTEEAKLLGARPLEPEQSLNRSFGIVFDVASFPTLTIDYYSIAIDGRIVPTTEFRDSSVTRILAEHGKPGIAGAQYYANAADTRTRGVDIVGRHAVVFGGQGILSLTGGYNRTRTKITALRSTPEVLQRLQSTLFGRTQRGAIEHGQPDQTVSLSGEFLFKRLNVSLHQQRFGKTQLLDSTDPAKDQTVEPAWITDIGFSYSPARGITASLSVTNLFDVYPSEWIDYKDGVNGTGLSVAGNFRYAAAISPFGVNGRTLYLNLRLR